MYRYFISFKYKAKNGSGYGNGFFDLPCMIKDEVTLSVADDKIMLEIEQKGVTAADVVILFYRLEN